MYETCRDVKNTDKSDKNIRIYKDIKICIEHIASFSLILSSLAIYSLSRSIAN